MKKSVHKKFSSSKTALYTTGCIMCLMLFNSAKAQTQLYFENFNSGGGTWTLNTADLGSYAATDQNYWYVDNTYAGLSLFVPDTPDEPAGIIGNPESVYLHITNGDNAGLDVFNCNFDAPTMGNMFAKMNVAVVTTGYDSVKVTFWYLCYTNASHYNGNLYYSVDGGTTWTLEPSFTAVYDVATWTQATIYNNAYNNVADLRFAVVFQQTGGQALAATDPAFAVDDFMVSVPSGSSACSVVITGQTSTNPSCSDSANATITITATDTGVLTYTINGGSAISNGTGIFTGLAPGTYTVAVSNAGCTTTDTDIVITAPAAVASPTAANNSPFCVGDTLNLTASTINGATYTWTGPQNFSVQNPSITNTHFCR